MQFPAFTGLELDNQEILLRQKKNAHNEMKIFDLAIITIGLQLFVFQLIPK